jgi:broad specificity phosphatase PhoE
LSVKRAYIIRHGQTDWNMAGRWQGSLPVPLNAHGHEQALLLADALRSAPIKAVYTSDLPRAYDTAKALADALNLTPITDPRLQEIHLGVFQGLTRDEIIARYPQDWEALHNTSSWYEYQPPGGESRRETQQRVFTGWQDIIARETVDEIALVSHGMTIRLLMLKLFEGETERLRRTDFVNTSVTVIERRDSSARWKLAKLADSTHLTPAERKQPSRGEANE